MPTTKNDQTVAELLEQDPAFLAAIKAIDAGRAAWLSIKEAAALLNLSVRQVRRYQAAGIMPLRKNAGRELRYARVDVEAIKAQGPTGRPES